MAPTPFQRDVCRLLAWDRRKRKDSYVAGAAALNELLRAPRRSRDSDLFHDTEAALSTSWNADRRLLTGSGYRIEVLRESAGFVEALVAKDADSILMQWARDSAYRFFPLLEDDTLGLVLHPFDLAVNKVSALVGRLEPRDWIDVLVCHEQLQPLGFLVWAACGKDPGYNPSSLLNEAQRTGRYSQAELDLLDCEGPKPDARQLGGEMDRALKEAAEIIGLLPFERVGTCVLAADGDLFRQAGSALARALEAGRLHFHHGAIGGVWPKLLGGSAP